MEKLHIVISPEFGADSLWWYGDSVSETRLGPIDFEKLPLSRQTIKRLDRWQRWHESIFDSEYPPDSEFSSKKEEEAFEEEGIAIWYLIQEELGAAYQVAYRSVITGEEFESLDEYEKKQI